eukprot:GGOE01040935.1.p2 GENE.GGOE01040935.1~~GGOE01040935.1.p2  ORF type:complete len:156 (+),score=34.91 GGOE01040935.1:61-468(+)
MDELHEAIHCVAWDLARLEDELHRLRQGEASEEDFLRRSSILRERKERKEAVMQQLAEQLRAVRRCLSSARRLCDAMEARNRLDIEFIPDQPAGHQEFLLRARSPILFYPSASHPSDAPPHRRASDDAAKTETAL